MSDRNLIAAFSRNGNSSPFGKLDERIDPFKVESAVKEELVRQAAERGVPLAEYLREITRIVAFGRTRVVSVYADRVDQVGRKLEE